MYEWVTSLYSRNWDYTVNQPYLKKKKEKKNCGRNGSNGRLTQSLGHGDSWTWITEMERRQHYKEWVTTEEEWSQGWLPGFWFWLPRGLTPPEVDNMGRAVGFKMGRVREKEMTVWFWFSEMWDSCGTSEWNCLKKCWQQNSKSYSLWEWSGVMKRGHGCEDHGKDIGRLGRDMEPNYGTRYVVYAYVGCQELWRGELDVFSALFYMNPQE